MVRKGVKRLDHVVGWFPPSERDATMVPSRGTRCPWAGSRHRGGEPHTAHRVGSASVSFLYVGHPAVTVVIETRWLNPPRVARTTRLRNSFNKSSSFPQPQPRPSTHTQR